MKIGELRGALAPLLASSIAISFGGTAALFSLISASALLSQSLWSATEVVWLIDLILGIGLLVAGFGTLLRSSIARRAALGLLIAGAIEDVFRDKMLLLADGRATSEASSSVLIPLMLVVAAILISLPASVKYTSNFRKA